MRKFFYSLIKVDPSTPKGCAVRGRHAWRKFMAVVSTFFVITGISSCQESLQKDYTTEEIWLVSHKTEKKLIYELVENEVECMVVTSLSSPHSEPFYVPLNGIRGFDYQIGYRYKIKVLITHLANPPQDSSNQIFALECIFFEEKIE